MIACWEMSASDGQLKQTYPDPPTSKGYSITLHTDAHSGPPTSSVPPPTIDVSSL